MTRAQTPSPAYTWPEDTAKPAYAPVFLSDEAYSQTLQTIPMPCADIQPYLRNPDRLVVVKRSNKPMDGWWHFGGRLRIGETEHDGAIRHFKRDAGTILTPERLTYLGHRHYYWHDRQQEPQNTPCHSLAFTFGLEPTEDELAQMKANLTLPEYVPDTLTTMDWKRLQGHDIHPALRELYVRIFGQPQQGRWNKPAVTEVTNAIAISERSRAIARQIINDFSQQAVIKKLNLMAHPNRAYLSNLVEGYYTDRVVHDFYRDNCPSGERILREKKPGWQQSAEEFYAIYAGRKALTGSGR